MRLCLAGTFPAEKIVKEYRPEYVLESFFYIRPWQIEEIPKWKMFLLDSGAFTFMHGIEASSKPVDWEGYLSRYIDFINRNNVQHFFELDVDSIVGYDAVKRMRARLEAETGKQSIPVWHRSRGLDEFKRLCRDYPYIGIGGFAIKHIQPSEYGYSKQPPALKDFYERMKSYVPSAFLTAFMAIPFPREAKELLFIVQKPKGEKNA